MIDDRPVRRRTALLGAIGLAGALAACSSPPPGPPPASPDVYARLAEIGHRFGGRLGVFGLDTGTGRALGLNSDERFLLCSTGKVPTVGATLRRAQDDPGLLDRVVRYGPAQLVSNSPITGKHVADGMTVAQLCEAALTVSDNTAENLLLDQVGGPQAMTAFVRGLRDPVTRYDRPEPALNETTPGDERDTTTPSVIGRDLQALVLGDALAPPGRERLTGWMVANTTGAAQIRAGVPVGWRVADKTGSGAQGESNDIGVVWPPGRAPLVIAVYTSPTDPKNTTGKETIAAAARAVVEELVG